MKRNDLETIVAHQAQGAFVRARARYKIKGEKPTRLFCSLEKHNSIQKYIPKLKVLRNNQEIILTEQRSIENEILGFYKDLFTKKIMKSKKSKTS